MLVMTVALDSEPLLLLGSRSEVVDRLLEVFLMLLAIAGTTKVTKRLVLLPTATLGIVGNVTTPETRS